MDQTPASSKLACENGHPLRAGLKFCPVCGAQRNLPGIVRSPVAARVLLGLVFGSFLLAFMQAGCEFDLKGPNRPTTHFTGYELVSGSTHRLPAYGDEPATDVTVPPQPWALVVVGLAGAAFAATFASDVRGAAAQFAASMLAFLSLRILWSEIARTIVPRTIYRQVDFGWVLAFVALLIVGVLSAARAFVLAVRARRWSDAQRLRGASG
ncbi:MAG: hypothetical protein ABR548_02355 [Actinomycetota bacterium]|nr:hypothetical protein [Actinomycetota bacterium]